MSGPPGGGREREPPSELIAPRGLSIAILAFGLVIVAVTLANGGGVASTGLVLGLLFTALGAGRLYLALRDR